MLGQLSNRKLNHALILLLLSLVAYSAIGLTIDLSPVQADARPTVQELAIDTPTPASDVATLPVSTFPQ